jgi:hypothetical protein
MSTQKVTDAYRADAERLRREKEEELRAYIERRASDAMDQAKALFEAKGLTYTTADLIAAAKWLSDLDRTSVQSRIEEVSDALVSLLAWLEETSTLLDSGYGGATRRALRISNIGD